MRGVVVRPQAGLRVGPQPSASGRHRDDELGGDPPPAEQLTDDQRPHQASGPKGTAPQHRVGEVAQPQ